MNKIIPAGLLLALFAAPASAQEAAAAVKSLETCRAIKDDGQRLACFDRAAASFAASVEKKDLVILDRGEVRRTKRSLFGFALPKLPFFASDKDEKGEEKPEFTEINSTVTGVRGLGYGKFAVTLEEGAVWQTTEPVIRDPQVGDKVIVKQGLMTNYFIKFNSGRAARAMRVR